MLSSTQNPFGTLYFVWEQSRTNDPLKSPQYYQDCFDLYVEHPLLFDSSSIPNKEDLTQTSIDMWNTGKIVHDICLQLLSESVPVTENIQFVFYIENMSVALREQLVRHRIGTQVGERLGSDIIPDLPSSTWWSQTTRVLPLDNFATEGRYLIPESLEGKMTTVAELSHKGTNGYQTIAGLEAGTEASVLYNALMGQIEFVYNELIKSGVPREDARLVMPMAMSHGITWGINLKALMHICGKRGCWIAQAGLWNDLMVGMIEEISTKISPMFRSIIHPPCLKKGKYVGCPIKMINLERIEGRDGMPPCPLYINHENDEAYERSVSNLNNHWNVSWASDSTDIRTWACTAPDADMQLKMLNENCEKYQKLWNLNVQTGERL